MLLGRQLLGRRVLASSGRPARLLLPCGHVRQLAGKVRASEGEAGPPKAPEVGWMWQTSSGAGGKAGATRANLKQANIKAKK
jgi:hypothetical protein